MILISVRNFQSIEHSAIEVDGFTVVTGPNNSGKTALMRAVRGVFTNAKGTSFVRYGTDACEVAVEFDDGQRVVWEKGKLTNRYTVNGKILDKVGSGVPPEVEALGIFPITAGNQLVWPQIAPQFTGQVFLLDQSGSVLAEALSDVERVGKLSRALKASDSDKRQAVSELKVRRSDAKALASEMASFDGLDDALDQVDAVEATATALHALRGEIESLQGLSERLVELQNEVQRLEPGATATVGGNPTGLVALSSEIDALADLRNRMTQAQRESAKWRGADALAYPVGDEVSTLASAKDELSQLKSLKAKLDSAKSAHAKVSGFETPTLDSGKSEKASKVCAILRDFKAQIASHKRDQVALAVEKQGAELELAEAQKLVSELLLQMPTCPTCGKGHSSC